MKASKDLPGKRSIARQITAALSALSILLSPALSIREASAKDAACDQACAGFRDKVGVKISDPRCAANKDCRQCMEQGHANSQASPYCQAYDTYKKGSTAQAIGASVYTIAAATCLTACAAKSTGVGAIAETACPFAGIAVTLSNMAMASKVKAMNPEFLNWAQTTAQNADSLISMGSMLTGAMAAVKTVKGAGKEAGKKGAEEGGKKAIKESCITGALFGIVAILKSSAAATMSQPKKKVCAKILDLDDQKGSTLLSSCMAKIKDSGTFKIAAATSPDKDGDDSSGDGGGANIPNPDSFSWGDSTVQAAVGAGPASDLLQKMTNPIAKVDGIPDFKDVLKKIEGGESPSSILGGIPVDAAISDKMKEFGEAAKNGETFGLLKDAGSTYATTGGAKKKGGAEDDLGLSFMEFGTSAGAGAAPEEAAFQGKVVERHTGDYDIFHTGYPGTIFELISSKMKDDPERLVTLEPALPLNRALAGFKNPPASRGGK